MIVVDTNVIAYLLLPTPDTDLAERLLRQDPEWCAPLLWRSELRNVLALYLRKGLIDFTGAVRLQEEAESLLWEREYQVPSADVLEWVAASPCSAYDCEFVALAKGLDVPMVTSDRKVLNAFPDITWSLRAYVEGP